VLTGGMRLPELGRNFLRSDHPGHATHEMRIMREETFGPVLSVAPFDDDEQAIRLATTLRWFSSQRVDSQHRTRRKRLPDAS